MSSCVDCQSSGGTKASMGSRVSLGAGAVTAAKCLWPRGRERGDSASGLPSAPGVLPTHCFLVKGHHTQRARPRCNHQTAFPTVQRTDPRSLLVRAAMVGERFPDDFFPREVECLIGVSSGLAKLIQISKRWKRYNRI